MVKFQKAMLWVIIAVLYIKSLESFIEIRKGKKFIIYWGFI